MGFFDKFKKKKKDSKSKVTTKSEKIPVEKTELDTTEIKIENKQIIKPKSISDEIRIFLSEQYMTLYRKITGQDFSPVLGDVKTRILNNLELEKVKIEGEN